MKLERGSWSKWKKTEMEDDRSERGPKWKTTKMEDDRNGRRLKWKMIKGIKEQPQSSYRAATQQLWSIHGVSMAQSSPVVAMAQSPSRLQPKSTTYNLWHPPSNKSCDTHDRIDKPECWKAWWWPLYFGMGEELDLDFPEAYSWWLFLKIFPEYFSGDFSWRFFQKIFSIVYFTRKQK